MLEHSLQHPIGLVHLLLALLAMGFGAAIMLSRKGTQVHRWLGRSYTASMCGLNLTAFLIYELFAGFGLFHWLALISLITVVLGYRHAWRRRPGWKASHAYFMAGSYVGLIAAFAAEILTRTDILPFFSAVAVASFAVIFIGVWLMFRLIPRLV